MPAMPRSLLVVLLLACAVIGCLAWALWWPEPRCADPVCVRKRFSLFVELDAFQRVPALELEQSTGSGRLSIEKLLASAGLDVTIQRDQTELPYDASAGRLDRADLYQYAQAWRGLQPPRRFDGRMYALLVPGLIADNGETLFGLMFDYTGREGFAVAPSETITRFQKHNGPEISRLQLRTFAHELLHALNRSHIDAAPLPDGRLTVEAPTRCISKDVGPDWQLEQTPALELSPATILFFQTGAAADVLPGPGNTPFDLRRGSANECAEIRSQSPVQRAGSRWDFALARLRHLFALSEAHAEEPVAADDTQAQAQAHAAAAEVRVQALPAAYPLGYPIAVRIIVKNIGQQALPLRGRLLPGFGMIQVEVRATDTDAWRAVRPLAWYEPAEDDDAMLKAGDVTQETVPIYFGESGWSFPEPGEYEVRALLRLGDDQAVVQSQPVRIGVAAPSADRDRLALDALRPEGTQLDDDLGRLLAFGGRIGSHRDLTPIEQLIREYPDTALGSALRLTQASHELRPPIDPKTGKRRPADTSTAEALLDDTCTDSGVAALRRELIERHASVLPSLAVSLEQPSEAWDGFSRKRDTYLRTYADPELERAGPSLHFCFDETTLRGSVRDTARRFGRELAAVKPARVVVVGHTDSAASCRYNDRLGLQRAETVRSLLVRSGVRADRIVTVSLGERRPNDFASTPDAASANRRVEVLIDTDAEERRQQRVGHQLGQASLPRCPSR